MTKPFIKVSGISSLTDARYCAGMEVDYLGIRFDKDGKGDMERNLFVSISSWIEGPVWVGEYEGNEPKLLLELAREFGIKTWQVESTKLAEILTQNDISVGLKLKTHELDSAEIQTLNLAYLLLECHDLTEKVWEFIRKMNAQTTVLVEPVSSISQIEKIRTNNPQIGFNLYSGQEERSGWMDLTQLQDILEAIEDLPS